MSKSLLRIPQLLGLILAFSAHVGSPNFFFSGRAGPYEVRVVVIPAKAIPGLAEISVRTTSQTVESVLVQPLFWDMPAGKVPEPEKLKKVSGSDSLFTGSVWLMAVGAYNLRVTVSGSEGEGSVGVPIQAAEVSEPSMGDGLLVILGVLATLLVLGGLAIIGGIARYGSLDSASAVNEQSGTKALRAVLGGAMVFCILALCGTAWWKQIAKHHAELLYQPFHTVVEVTESDLGQVIKLKIDDPVWAKQHQPVSTGPFSLRDPRSTPLIADHGKLMHMFLIRKPDLDAVAHLHPVLSGEATFTSLLPPLPAGEYAVYSEVTHESGFTQTFINTAKLPTVSGKDVEKWFEERSDIDDSFLVSERPSQEKPSQECNLSEGARLVWERETGSRDALRFSAVGSGSSLVELEPYMGMAAHMVISRSDEPFFVHLHPTGSTSMAAQRTLDEKLSMGSKASAHYHEERFEGRFSFPYNFPKAGHYHLWVQVKHGEKIHTCPFDLTISEQDV